MRIETHKTQWLVLELRERLFPGDGGAHVIDYHVTHDHEPHIVLVGLLDEPAAYPAAALRAWLNETKAEPVPEGGWLAAFLREVTPAPPTGGLGRRVWKIVRVRLGGWTPAGS